VYVERANARDGAIFQNDFPFTRPYEEIQPALRREGEMIAAFGLRRHYAPLQRPGLIWVNAEI
jgi:hypothetical protein